MGLLADLKEMFFNMVNGRAPCSEAPTPEAEAAIAEADLESVDFKLEHGVHPYN
jgi:hypothetical protein